MKYIKSYIWPLLALDFILFHSLLFNGYIAMHDFSTIPYFVNCLNLIPQSLTGTYLSLPPFGVQFDPGMNLLTAFFMLLFNHYAINFLAFLLLFFYTAGLYYFFFQFSSGFRAFIGAVFAVLFVGVLNNIIDTPLGLYVWFLPFTLGLYYKYRLSGRKEYLLLSAVPAALSTPYGPAMPSLFFGLLAVELSIAAEKRELRALLKGVASIAAMIIMYVVTHLVIFLYSAPVLSGLYKTFYATLNPGFNLYQILTSGAVYAWEQYPSAYMPSGIYSLYTWLLIILACVLVFELAAIRAP